MVRAGFQDDHRASRRRTMGERHPELPTASSVARSVARPWNNNVGPCSPRITSISRQPIPRASVFPARALNAASLAARRAARCWAGSGRGNAYASSSAVNSLRNARSPFASSSFSTRAISTRSIPMPTITRIDSRTAFSAAHSAQSRAPGESRSNSGPLPGRPRGRCASIRATAQAGLLRGSP